MRRPERRSKRALVVANANAIRRMIRSEDSTHLESCRVSLMEQETETVRELESLE